MITAKGNTVQPGIAIGTIRMYHKTDLQILPDKTKDTSAEWKKYLQGKKEAAAQLKKMEKLAVQKAGREESMIFGAHQMILSDPHFEEIVKEKIKEEHFNAAYAVYLAGEAMAGDLAAIEEDPYMKDRAVDFRDVSMRVIRRIRHVKEEMEISSKPVILLADDLTPSETIGLHTDKILSFVTVGGSTDSHTAILARSFGIPTLVNTEMELSDDLNGKTAIVDALNGTIMIDPTEEQLQKMTAQKASYEKQQEELKDPPVKQFKGTLNSPRL